MEIHCIIQARCGSSRFPRKVFAEINNKPLIGHVVERLKRVQIVNNIIVATTINKEDDAIVEWCNREGVSCFRGSENDVLNRYYCAARYYNSDIIVRITADDPFKEPKVIDRVIEKLLYGKYDLVTNNYPPSFPEGLDCEAFTFEVLEKMENEARDLFDREHVTQYVYRHPKFFKIGNVMSEKQLSNYRWTIDTKEDYDMVNEIYRKRDNESDDILLMDEILEIINKYPEIAKINSTVKRSAMYE